MSNKSSQQVTQQVRAIYADPYASAVVAEYVVVKVNCVNGVVDSKRRLQKVEVPENIVSRTSDPWKILDSLGLDDKWLSHVKEALVELHGRRDKWLGGASTIGPQRDEESTTASADQCLELLYGNREDKIRASSMVASQCCHVANLISIADSNQLMSALARVMREDGSESYEVSFSILKVFLALSDFSEIHPLLSTHRVGPQVMNALLFEVRRARNQTFTHMQEGVVCAMLGILDNLAEDIEIRQKMLKRGLLPSLLAAFVLCSTKDCLHSALSLVRKATMFEEVVDKIACQEDELGAIDVIVSLLGTGTVPENSDLPESALRVLSNLSYHDGCRKTMIESNLVQELIGLLRHGGDKSSYPLSLKTLILDLLYHLSSGEDGRCSFANEEALSVVNTLVHEAVEEDGIARDLAISLSLQPFCGYRLIGHRCDGILSKHAKKIHELRFLFYMSLQQSEPGR